MLNRGCKFKMPDGRLCRSPALRGQDYCMFHSPAHEEQAAEIRRLGGLRRRREKTVAGAFDLDGLRTVADFQRLLEVAALDALGLDNSIARVRALTYLSQVGVKILQAGELEERIAALEAERRDREVPTRADFDVDPEAEDDDYKERVP
jgi:hypothetical protein